MFFETNIWAVEGRGPEWTNQVLTAAGSSPKLLEFLKNAPVTLDFFASFLGSVFLVLHDSFQLSYFLFQLLPASLSLAIEPWTASILDNRLRAPGTRSITEEVIEDSGRLIRARDIPRTIFESN